MLNNFCEAISHSQKDRVFKKSFFEIETKRAIGKEDTIFKPLDLGFSLQTSSSKAIVWITPEKIDLIKNKINAYRENGDSRTYLNEIVSIRGVPKEEKSQEVTEWLNSEIPKNIEIDILPNLGKEYYEELIKVLDNEISQENGKIFARMIDENIASFRAFIRPQTAKRLLEKTDAIWQTRILSALVLEKPQKLEIKELPAPREAPIDLPIVCVLDSGVNEGHSFLKKIVSDSGNFSSDLTAADCKDGHGTFVAGLAAYGSLENLGNSPIPTAKIINAKVFGDSEDTDFLENRLIRAVKHFQKDTRIFTLSVMYPVCCNISKPSNLALTIDNLANKYKINFVICTGNLRDELNTLISLNKYPDYLKNDKCTLFFGAEATNAITVGGIAHKDNSCSIAKAGQPSPFTRRGEYRKRSKPDIVSSAGNLELNNKGGLNSNNSALGVISLDKEDNTFAYGIGTSYSAPIIANILAKLSKEYPEASPNLLKALLIHFAYVPSNSRFLDADCNLQNVLYGKGVVEFERSAFCQNSAPTYIIEDSIRTDQVANIPIYIPKEMGRIFGAKRIKVTLVYNPPVNVGVDGYTLIDLDFQLYKRLKDDSIQPQTRWKKKFRNEWDNVKSDILEWQHNGWGKEWLLKITPSTRFKSNLLPPQYEQEYAVIVSLEDPSGDHNLYDAIFEEQTTLAKKKVEVKIKTKKPKVIQTKIAL